MSSSARADDHPETIGTSGRVSDHDWKAIEGAPEFHELVQSKRRFVVPAALVALAVFLTYLLLAAYARDFMATRILGGIPVSWALASLQVLLTWGVTWLYLRKADSEWDELEHRATARAIAAAGGTGAGSNPRRASREVPTS
jgi:uncharacterized membrane protein (DUF485 family)